MARTAAAFAARISHAFGMDILDSGERHLPAMLFLHGWPDTAALWDAQVEHFAGRYRCLRVTLPDFGDERSSERPADFPELVERIVAAAKSRLAPGERVILVGHDWGASLAYRIEQAHPQFVERMVTMDVGAHITPRSFRHLFFLVSYQWWLVSAWMIGKFFAPLGDAMTRMFSMYARAPRGPGVRARSNYLYAYLWRAMVMKKYRGTLLRRYRPQAPLLYLFGEAKRYMFHSQRWLDLVDATPGSRAVGVPDCGHWLMMTNPGLTNDLIDEWLADADVRATPRTHREDEVAGAYPGLVACEPAAVRPR